MLRQFNFKHFLTVLTISLLTSFVFLSASNSVFAAYGVNRQINFQGKLVTNPQGTNVSNTSYTVIFTLYDAASGGTALWTETQTVTTTDGIFRVALGSVTPIPSNFNFNWSGLYLGIKVNSDAEMSPRIQMASVPFAFNSQQVAGLTVQDTSGNASTSGTLQVANNVTVKLPNSGTGLIYADTGTTGNLSALTNSTSQTGSVVGLNLTLSGATSNFNQYGIQFNLSGTTSGNQFDMYGTSGNWNISSAGIFNSKGLTLTSGAITLGGATGSGQCLTGGATASWGSCGGGGTSPFTLITGTNGGFIQENNTTADLIVGGTSTASADFAVLGLNNNKATATVSGQFIVMANNGWGGQVGIGTLTPQTSLDVNGTINGTKVRIGGGSEFSLVSSSVVLLDQVGGGDADLRMTGSIAVDNNGNSGSICGDCLEFGIAGTTGSKIWSNQADNTVGNNYQGLDLGTNNTPVLSLVKNGLVGIQTRLPLGTLDVRPNLVNGGTIPVASVSGKTSFASMVIDQSGLGDIFTASSSGATRFVIQNNGNVGVGVSNPLYNLDLANTFHMAYATQPTLENLTIDLTKEYQTNNTPNLTLQTYAPSIYLKDTTPSSTSFTEFVDGNNFMIRKETGTYSSTDWFFQISSAGLVSLANNLSLTGSSPIISATGTNVLSLNNSSSGNIDFFSTSNFINSSGSLTLAGNISLTGSNPTVSATGTNTLTLNSGGTGNIQFFGPSYGITSGGALTVASCSGCGTGGGGVNYFGQSQGLTFVGNTTTDFAIGGNSTSSADFVFGGINNPANGGMAIATFSGALMMNSQPDSSVFDQSNWKQISGTLGTIGGNTTTQIASISAMAAYNGSIYVGTYKNPAGVAGSAEVYRYNGNNSSWTLVSQSGGTGQIRAGDTQGIASVSAMTVFNGALYVGTSKMNSAEVYRYEGGTTWTKVSGPTAGTFGAVTAIDGVSSLGVYQGQLYAGTREPAGARLMSYGGGITWTAVNTTAGTFVATNTVGVQSVGPMVVKNGFLYFATQKTGDTDLIRYSGGQGATNAYFLSMNAAGLTGSYNVNGANLSTAVDEITAMTVYNGAVIVAVRRQNGLADVLQLNDGMTTGTTSPNSFTRLNNASGQMCNTCTTTIDAVSSLTVYNGYLYAGTNKAGKAEIYRYVGGDQKFVLVSQSGGTGQIASGGQSGIYAVSNLQPINTDLYAATFFGYSGGVEIYKLSNVNIDKSYSIIFHSAPSMGQGEQNGNANMASIYYLASASANLGNSSANSGAFVFDHGIQTRNGSYDVAEDYPTRDDTLTPGDVVSIDPNETGFVTKSATVNDYRVIGVFSSNPALRLSQQDAFINGGYVVPIALAGRVPVKVSTEGGEIKPGDYLTPSSTPGIAMRATRSGGVIGQAMEGYSGDGVGKILIYVKSMTYQGSLADNFANLDTKAPDFAVNVLNQLSANPFDGTSSITTDRLIAGLQLITPEVDATKINISEINPLSGGNIALNLTEDGKFIISGSNSSITFDSEGNAIFPGLVIADKIKANQIIGLDIFTNRLSSIDESIATLSSQLSSGSAVLGDSTQSQTLTLSSLNVDGLATVSGDFNVKGNSIFERALTVLDSIATQNLIVSNFATFFDDVVFKGNTRFAQTPTFNSDTGGFAVVSKGNNSVQVSFENEYVNTPVVTASIVLDKLSSDGQQQQLESDILNGNITFVVTQRTTKGFVIKLNKEAPDDINFSWVSLSVDKAKTFGVSQSPSPSPSLSPSPSSTPSAAVQSILNQLNGQGPGNGGG